MNSSDVEPYRSIWEYTLDCAIGFALFVAAFFVAGAVVDSTHDRVPMTLAYPTGISLGLIPFFWFTKLRRVNSLSWSDFLRICGLLAGWLWAIQVLSWGIAAVFPNHPNVSLFASVAVMFVVAPRVILLCFRQRLTNEDPSDPCKGN